MPNPLRRALLALAVAASVFTCATAAANSELPATSVEKPKPTLLTHRAPAHRAPTRARKLKPTLGERAARNALRAVGVPYQWGGTSPSSGFDCSGLVYWAYGRLGIAVPHSSYALYHEGRGVARSRMKAGDVLIFSGLGHVGLYVGRGRMVHAPHSGALVEIVRLGNSSYGSRIVSVRRIASG
jgi:cell wall-associated NlpC family hydrolase